MFAPVEMVPVLAIKACSSMDAYASYVVDYASCISTTDYAKIVLMMIVMIVVVVQRMML